MALARISSWSTLRLSLSKLTITSDKKSYSLASNYLQFKPILSTNLPSLICISGKKTVAEELGLPAPPKRPSTPFLRFIAKEKSRYPKLSPSEKVSRLGQDWSILDPSVKSQYLKDYQSELESYRKRSSKYLEQLSADQIKEIKELTHKKKLEKRVQQERRKVRKECEQLGKPKHPGNVFTIFFESLMSPQGDIKNCSMKEAAEQWHALPETKKSSFKDESKKRALKYKEELTKWENKMQSTGRNDLVRKLPLSAASESSAKN